MYGIQGDGAFILLSGEVGTGKTTICRCLLEQIPNQVDTAFILNPKLTAAELLAAACDDLKIDYPENASIKVLTDQINAYLLEAHARDRRTVLIIDEAQNLSIEVLEQLRLLISKTLLFLSVCPFLNARVRFFRKRASSSSGTFYDDAFRREGREDQ